MKLIKKIIYVIINIPDLVKTVLYEYLQIKKGCIGIAMISRKSVKELKYMVYNRSKEKDITIQEAFEEIKMEVLE